MQNLTIYLLNGHQLMRYKYIMNFHVIERCAKMQLFRTSV